MAENTDKDEVLPRHIFSFEQFSKTKDELQDEEPKKIVIKESLDEANSKSFDTALGNLLEGLAGVFAEGAVDPGQYWKDIDGDLGVILTYLKKNDPARFDQIIKYYESEEVQESAKPVYWLSHVGGEDDFGDPITDEFIDGKTKMGPWANMTPASWKKHGIGLLGLGKGQRYKKQPDGKWLKIEG